MENATVADAITGNSRVHLRSLCERKDGDSWVIGRIETGDFISVPDVAQRAITLLGQGHSVAEVAALLRAETGATFAVAGFAVALDELGFLAAVDGEIRADTARPRPSLPRLRPQHVRWLLSPLWLAVVVGFAVVIVVMLALHHGLIPCYRVLVWNRHAGLVIAVNAAIAWLLILLHELAHLGTARAAGAPARITLGTRLQFLTAQTDVSGIWAAPRRTRMTVYLAGMGVDVCSVGICLLILGLANPHGLVRSLLAVAVAESLLALPTQFMVFMRTDLYFVLQDLTRCANLYADGSAYVRYLGRRITRRAGHRDEPNPDPSREYPRPQRRAVRVYSIVLLFGTAICLGVECAVSLPALITLVVRAASEIGGALIGTLDGSAALAILLAWQAIWSMSWWRRHQHQVRSAVSTYLAAARRWRDDADTV